MKLQGTISISRTHCSNGQDYIELAIRDERSGVQFLKGEIGLTDFAKLVTGQSEMPVALDLRGVESVGKFRETKSESVFFPDGDYHEREFRAKAAIAPLQVDGWIGDWRQLGNHHAIDRAVKHVAGGTFYKIGFYRFLDQLPPALPPAGNGETETLGEPGRRVARSFGL